MELYRESSSVFTSAQTAKLQAPISSLVSYFIIALSGLYNVVSADVVK